VGVVLPVVATVAAMFSVTYALRFSIDVFLGPKATDLPREPHEPVHWMRVPIELLVVLCLLVGTLPATLIGPILDTAARPVGERAKILMRIHDAVLQHRDELLDIIQLETGKNRASALDEVMDVAINARYYARHAARLLRPRRVRGARVWICCPTAVCANLCRGWIRWMRSLSAAARRMRRLRRLKICFTAVSKRDGFTV